MLGAVAAALAVGYGATGVAWPFAMRRVYRHPSKPDARLDVTTADGWRLALHRYRASGPRRNHPVVLCPGLGANRVSFDLSADLSLAKRLARNGYEVFVPELRGHGLSEMPRLLRGRRRFGWTFDDYLTKDVPAHLDAIAKETGTDSVHWVGHSMGGILLFALLASGGSKRIRSGTTVGSSIDYSGSSSWFKTVAKASFLTRLLPALPLGYLSLTSAPMAARLPGNLTDVFVVWPSNVDPKAYRLLQATCFSAVSSGVLRQLATAFRPGGLTSADGATRYAPGLAGATAPVLVIAGDRDRQCPPEAAKASFDVLGSPDKKLLAFGKQSGLPDHYGHFDLLMGKRAATEVLPSIDAWIDAHD